MKRLALIFTFLATVAQGQSLDLVPGVWTSVPGLSSAHLARSGWTQNGASGLSWPDGRQAVISFWEAVINGQKVTVRCTTYFDANMAQTGDMCAQAVDPE